MEPPEPEVAMAVGESRQFACRLACADGQVASVQWRGLDTSLGSVKSGTGSSVLWVHNASLSAAGTRMCVGYCGKRSFHHTVNLLVFGKHPLPAALSQTGPSQRPCFPSVPWHLFLGGFPDCPSFPSLRLASQVLLSCPAVCSLLPRSPLPTTQTSPQAFHTCPFCP